MNNIAEMAMKHRNTGLSCSQALMATVGLEARGVENPILIEAMCGLSGGMFAQYTCGALTGAACSMALYGAPKGELGRWCIELSAWFEERYGVANCLDLVGPEKNNPALCNTIIQETCVKAVEILKSAGRL